MLIIDSEKVTMYKKSYFTNMVRTITNLKQLYLTLERSLKIEQIILCILIYLEKRVTSIDVDRSYNL